MMNYNYDDLEKYSYENNFLMSVHMNIISTCNLKCKHCFMPEKNELISFEEVKYIAACLEELGTLYVTLSGGEVFMHPEFEKIYVYLKQKGFIVSIMSNGTLLSKKLMELFSLFPPERVDLSIYGYDENSFNEFTRSKNGFDIFIKGVQLLKEAKVNYRLKTPLTMENIDSLNKYLELFDNLQCNYFFGSHIYSSFDGSMECTNQRVSAKKTVEALFNLPNYKEAFKETLEKNELEVVKKLQCTAGINRFVINSDKSLSLCLICNYQRISFNDEESLKSSIKILRRHRIKLEQDYKKSICASCIYYKHCPGCPAHLINETGSIDKCPSYFRNIVEEKINQLNLGD